MVNISLKLYIKGTSVISQQAEALINEICTNYNIHLTVTDIEDSYSSVEPDPVLVVPTLVILNPPPVRHIISGLTDRQNILSCLGLA